MWVASCFQTRLVNQTSRTCVRGFAIREAIAELQAFVSAELKRQLDAKVVEELRASLRCCRDGVHIQRTRPCGTHALCFRLCFR